MNQKILGMFLVAIAAFGAAESSSYAFARKLVDSTGQVKIGDDVPSDQAQLIVKDLAYLSTFKAASQDAELLHVMQLNEVTGSSLENWLHDRVQAVIGENTDLMSSISLLQPTYSYENPNDDPVIEKPENVSLNSSQKSSESKVMTVMANVGTVVYYVGKKNGSLLSFNVSGFDPIPMTSPRGGVIQIGEGLFVRFKAQATPDLDREVNSMYRLSTFFHEAHHSDGHGTSLGFFHATCPPEMKDYAGSAACDRNLNGPYTVGALMTKTFEESCQSCTEIEKEVLRVIAADSFSRIIKVTPPSPETIDNTTRLCHATASANSTLASLGIDLRPLPPECQLLTNCDASSSPYQCKRDALGTKSTEWDPAPEGRRS